MKPTTDILERINKNSNEHKDGVYTRLYRYLLREDIYYVAYQKLYANKGALTKGIDNDTSDGFSKKYVSKLVEELSRGTYKPKPVRREVIKKQNGKTRPLGIPSFRDKLLQEVIKNFLESIYEPIFSEFSHGFRPNRSCHTALFQVKNYFREARWFIEGDIKGCFDNIDHGKLIEILERKIKDSKFINVIKSFLKAGYIDNFEYNKTYSGCPQGGILSPILANIYLNELDKKVMSIKRKFDEKPIRQRTTSYSRIRSKIVRLQNKLKTVNATEKTVIIKEITHLKKELLKTPSREHSDKKLSYVRYADDWIIAVNGSKADCINIKREISEFLNDKYKLTLSEEKTLITHSRNKVRFLGYDISVRRNNQIFKNSIGVKKRKLSGSVNLSIPFEKIEKFLFEKGIVKNSKSKGVKSTHRKGWLYLPDEEIVERYNAEIRGILNYYNLAANYYKLGYFCYLMEYSCLATLTGKYNSSISKIKTKYRKDKEWVVRYKLKNGMTKEKSIVKPKDCKTNKLFRDTIPNFKFTSQKPLSIWSRLNRGICELCGKTGADFKIHQVSNLKNLEIEFDWQKVMKIKRLKTLVVCEECHNAIHS